MTIRTKETYQCICPVCGIQHEVVTEFLSTEMVVVNGISYASLSCGKHTAEELQKAWKKHHPEYNQ